MHFGAIKQELCYKIVYLSLFCTAIFFFQLKYFNLSANNIGDDGFVAIASCISRIEMLEIGSTDDEKLSMKGIRALSKAVQLLDKPVIEELLNMSLFTEYSV